MSPRIVIATETYRDLAVHRNGHSYFVRVPIQRGLIARALKLYVIISVTNLGDSPAYNLLVDNPVPDGTVYVLGSAGSGIETVLCSSDGGASFHPETAQFFAKSECTDIRWEIPQILPGERHKLEFEVVVGRAEGI